MVLVRLKKFSLFLVQVHDAVVEPIISITRPCKGQKCFSDQGGNFAMLQSYDGSLFRTGLLNVVLMKASRDAIRSTASLQNFHAIVQTRLVSCAIRQRYQVPRTSGPSFSVPRGSICVPGNETKLNGA